MTTTTTTSRIGRASAAHLLARALTGAAAQLGEQPGALFHLVVALPHDVADVLVAGAKLDPTDAESVQALHREDLARAIARMERTVSLLAHEAMVHRMAPNTTRLVEMVTRWDRYGADAREAVRRGTEDPHELERAGIVAATTSAVTALADRPNDEADRLRRIIVDRLVNVDGATLAGATADAIATVDEAHAATAE